MAARRDWHCVGLTSLRSPQQGRTSHLKGRGAGAANVVTVERAANRIPTASALCRPRVPRRSTFNLDSPPSRDESSSCGDIANNRAADARGVAGRERLKAVR
ncbi:unnamed protein product [Lampetra planeri]